MILGIDEVGRGPWAGPLVVGAVVLGVDIEGLTDSKKLTKKRREELDVIIRRDAAGYGLGWVSAEEIDQIGLPKALKLATIRAAEQVKASYHEIIIDGTINFLRETSKGKYVTTLAKGDLLVPSISAASIIAKVARDNYMAQQDRAFPGYGFASHVGYGTAAHRAAIEKLGVTPLHRLSFAPLAKYRTKDAVTVEHGQGQTIGALAEDKAAQDLSEKGHHIVARNWRTRWCEIDIIASKDDTLCFVEVKYRRSASQGGGVAAITPKKLQQMKFATEFYLAQNKISGKEVKLAVMAMSGTPPKTELYLEIE